jgi:hypothetical protein
MTCHYLSVITALGAGEGSDLPRGEGGDDCCLVALEKDVADLTVDRLEYCSLDKPMESGSLLTALAEIERNNSVRQE